MELPDDMNLDEQEKEINEENDEGDGTEGRKEISL